MTFLEYLKERRTDGVVHYQQYLGDFLRWAKKDETFPTEMVTWEQVKTYIINRKMNDVLGGGKWFWNQYVKQMKREGVKVAGEPLSIAEQERNRKRAIIDDANIQWEMAKQDRTKRKEHDAKIRQDIKEARQELSIKTTRIKEEFKLHKNRAEFDRKIIEAKQEYEAKKTSLESEMYNW